MARNTLQTFRLAALAGACAMLLWAPPSGAATELTEHGLATIGAEVRTTISKAIAALPQGSSRAELDAALGSAISAELKALIAENPKENPMILTEAVITAALDNGMPPSALGRGLADAALVESEVIGLEIADAVGSTAPKEVLNEFQTVTNAAGTPFGSSLASAAGSFVSIGAGDRAGGSRQMNFFGGTGVASGSGGGGGGCKNPSCT